MVAGRPKASRLAGSPAEPASRRSPATVRVGGLGGTGRDPPARGLGGHPPKKIFDILFNYLLQLQHDFTQFALFISMH